MMKAIVELNEDAVKDIIALYFRNKGTTASKITLKATKKYIDRPCSSSTAVFDKAIIEVEL